MLDQVPPEGEEPQGSSDNHPVVLAGVSLKDFEALVGHFNPDVPGFSDTKEEWISVLHLADMWSMEEVRQTACKKLYHHTFGPIEMLELAEKYHLPYQWAAPAFHQLVSRSNPLTVAESQRLNPKWAAAIAFVQHSNPNPGYGLGYNYDTDNNTASATLKSITSALKVTNVVEENMFTPSTVFPQGPPSISSDGWEITSTSKTQGKKNSKRSKKD
ncbi:hypothetical protein DL96DRAFT_1621198 [Flagelloscypha sp. PMI_526]|nr:hypothetical protein DL96DRAFT_1621198 [Flagelloscypha sp. PMI_526]